jgi:cellulose synthase/poly-beta-1,6-N-acetylglucosamine synthase-like glycosyltransferase
MVILIFINMFFLIAYGTMINFYRQSWNQIPLFSPPDIEPDKFSKSVSVIIPARNEEASIADCLHSLLNQTYPSHLVEILVINDHSEDRTEEIASGFNHPNIRLINLKDHIPSGPINSYKKKAIEIAITAATGEWILCTDADCILPSDWIRSMIQFSIQ